MKHWYHKITRFRYLPYLVAFFIPFLSCLGICIANGVYPFGNNCMLHVDMYHQYCPFFMEFLDKLQNKGSLLYSWNLGLGSDFVSLYAYYLSSPLNWLLILWPRAYVIEFMTLLVIVKISLSGLFFFYYLKEHFHLVGKDERFHWNTALPALVCAVAYALSGFVAAYNWDIMWMDCIALTPLIILGLEKLVVDNEVVLYYVSLAVSILANYYISMMICMFLVFYFIVLFFEKGEGRWKAFGRFSWYSILAGGTAAVLLIPEYLILGYSGSQGIDFPATIEWYFDLLDELVRSCATTFVYTGREHWPNIYSGVFTILFVVLYVLNRRISWKNKVTRLGFLLFLLISFSNNYLDFIWHGLHFPDSLPGRQSFLYSFVLLVITFDAIRKWKGTKLWHIACALSAAAVFIIAGYLHTDHDLVDPLAFAVTAIFIACYGIIMILCKISNRQMKKFFVNLAFALAVCELVANMAVTSFSVTSRTAYMQKMDDYETLLCMAKDKEDSENSVNFYRVEDLERMTKNDDMKYGYSSGTQFSSLMNINVSHFYQNVRMEGGKNFYCYNGATPLVSAMLSVKYILSDHVGEESSLRTMVGQSGNYTLYENNYCLPLGFMMPEQAIEQWDAGMGEKINNINLLSNVLGADSDLLQSAYCEVSPKIGSTEISIKEDGYFYALYTSCQSDTLTEEVSDGRTRKFSKTSHKYLLDLGTAKAGDSITIKNTNQETLSMEVYHLDLPALQASYETLKKQSMKLEEKTDTLIKGTIDVKEAGRLIFSIPKEAGWKLYVDGDEVEITSFEDTFISTYLEKGVHTIKLTYVTPGLFTGVAVSLGCIGSFVISVIIRKVLSKQKK